MSFHLCTKQIETVQYGTKVLSLNIEDYAGFLAYFKCKAPALYKPGCASRTFKDLLPEFF